MRRHHSKTSAGVLIFCLWTPFSGHLLHWFTIPAAKAPPPDQRTLSGCQHNSSFSLTKIPAASSGAYSSVLESGQQILTLHDLGGHEGQVRLEVVLQRFDELSDIELLPLVLFPREQRFVRLKHNAISSKTDLAATPSETCIFLCFNLKTRFEPHVAPASPA